MSSRRRSPREGLGGKRDFLQLLAHPLVETMRNRSIEGPNRGQGGLLDVEVELRRRSGSPGAAAGRPRRSARGGAHRAQDRPRSRSSRPPWGSSRDFRLERSKAMALIVKSRRDRSSSMVEANSTASGWRAVGVGRSQS